MDECFVDGGWRRSVVSVSTILALIRGSIGSYDPTYIPRFVRQLDPPPRRCLLAVKGWFAHSSYSMQRDPWLVVVVWCDGKRVGVLTQGFGRSSRLVAPLTVGTHLVKFVGYGTKRDTPTLLPRVPGSLPRRHHPLHRLRASETEPLRTKTQAECALVLLVLGTGSGWRADERERGRRVSEQGAASGQRHSPWTGVASRGGGAIAALNPPANPRPYGRSKGAAERSVHYGASGVSCSSRAVTIETWPADCSQASPMPWWSARPAASGGRPRDSVQAAARMAGSTSSP